MPMTLSSFLFLVARSTPPRAVPARLHARGVGGTGARCCRLVLAAALLGAELMACQKPTSEDVPVPGVEPPPQSGAEVDRQPAAAGVTAGAGAVAAPRAAEET